MKIKQIIIAALIIGFVGFILFAPEGQRSTPDLNFDRAEGKPAPIFELEDTNGKVWNLAQLKGSIVVINFWATWCPPCRKEMPSLSALHEKTKDIDDFVILTILNKDNPKKAVEYFKKNNFKMIILDDPDEKVAKMFGLAGVPETYIIGRDGVMIKSIVGPTEFDTPNALKYFGELAGQEL